MRHSLTLVLLGSLLAPVLATVLAAPALAGTVECSAEHPTFGTKPPSSHVYACHDSQGTPAADDDCYNFGIRPVPGSPVEAEYCR